MVVYISTSFRSTGAPRLHARKKEEERLAEKRTPLPKPPPIKTDKEKEELRKKMREKYEVKFDIPERILYMALESVLYDEDQANNLMWVSNSAFLTNPDLLSFI